MNIRPFGTNLLHEDRRTDMIKLTSSFFSQCCKSA